MLIAGSPIIQSKAQFQSTTSNSSNSLGNIETSDQFISKPKFSAGGNTLALRKEIQRRIDLKRSSADGNNVLEEVQRRIDLKQALSELDADKVSKILTEKPSLINTVIAFGKDKATPLLLLLSNLESQEREKEEILLKLLLDKGADRNLMAGDRDPAKFALFGKPHLFKTFLNHKSQSCPDFKSTILRTGSLLPLANSKLINPLKFNIAQTCLDSAKLIQQTWRSNKHKVIKNNANKRLQQFFTSISKEQRPDSINNQPGSSSRLMGEFLQKRYDEVASNPNAKTALKDS